MDSFVHNLDFGDLPSATLNPIISNPVSAAHSLIQAATHPTTPLTASSAASSAADTRRTPNNSASSSPHHQSSGVNSVPQPRTPHLTHAHPSLTPLAPVLLAASDDTHPLTSHHLNNPSPVSALVGPPPSSCVLPAGLNFHGSAANFIPASAAAVTQFPSFLPQSILAQTSAGK